MADARESVQAVAELMIEPDVELVVVSAVGNQVLIVVRARSVRRGEIGQHFAREWSHVRQRYSGRSIASRIYFTGKRIHYVLKLTKIRRSGISIEDGQDAVALIESRQLRKRQLL